MADMYRTIYDPKGVPFEVPPERAAQLVLNKGWSNTPPKKSSKKKTKASVEVHTPAPEPLAADVEDKAESPSDSE